MYANRLLANTSGQGIIGHELFHAFGVEGNYISPAENLTRSILNNRTQCFVTQYESYIYILLECAVSDVFFLKRFIYVCFEKSSYYTINGTRTLEENVADTIGLQVALNAYSKLLEEDCDNNDTRLEGLEMFTGKQLFFIGRAMVRVP
ncbi:hypothetical protein V5799_012440 [Amblyomma americanum]|uniref:Peptidase M13 C-terminal domain-containing protein n=1 Tax=Amblyomma americanum TaxID=6943 RepID=A0AAQ4EE01_AMBAM